MDNKNLFFNENLNKLNQYSFRTKKTYFQDDELFPVLSEAIIVDKQESLYYQYVIARQFLRLANMGDITLESNSQFQTMYNETLQKETLFEVSLIYYNIVIDLSWMLTISCLESIVYYEHTPNKLEGLYQTDLSEIIIAQLESLSTNPNACQDLLNYYTKNQSSASNIVEHIHVFWNMVDDKKSKLFRVRRLYNYIKHRGKPNIPTNSPIKLNFKSVGDKETPYATSINDIKNRTLDLNEELQELMSFDNEQLFPYIFKLFELLYNFIDIKHYVYH